ncbi:CapA family protein [Butyrivibrio sp. VCD2006]|uniref:CapA family protein n=1 Tax=Butyrivibrio sp. VCD2006 TaxID=1280664 RepID=UPI0004195D67|nr:CapA family protein [Butyrivibrio sp. VCD2006]
MKKEQYDSNNKGFFSGVNKAVIAFVCTFLITVSVGAVILLGVQSRNASHDEVENNQVSQEEQVSSRLPFSEKNPDSIGDTSSLISSSEEAGGDTDSSDAEMTGEEQAEATEEDADGADSEEADVDASEEGESVEESGETYISGANWEYSITPASGDHVSLAFAGDILFDPGYAIMNKIRQNGGGIEGVIGGSLLSYMRDADIMVVNNEFPYSNRGTPTEGKTFTFRADPSSAALLNQMGVDVATLANNHAYDHGEVALLDTLTAIDSVGVARIGAGTNIEEASHPVYYTADNGIKIAIIAATEIERLDNPDTKGATDTSPGVFRCLDITRLLSRIREAKATGAYVIVCIHWGTENDESIDWWQQKQGAEIADAGADLIVGAHPHILQKIGYVNGVPVIYSLGNFLFNSKDLDTGLLRVNIYTDGHTGLQFIPCVQSGCTVSEATGERKASILNHMRAMSDGISIDDEGNVQ